MGGGPLNEKLIRGQMIIGDGWWRPVQKNGCDLKTRDRKVRADDPGTKKISLGSRCRGSWGRGRGREGKRESGGRDYIEGPEKSWCHVEALLRAAIIILYYLNQGTIRRSWVKKRHKSEKEKKKGRKSA